MGQRKISVEKADEFVQIRVCERVGDKRQKDGVCESKCVRSRLVAVISCKYCRFHVCHCTSIVRISSKFVCDWQQQNWKVNPLTFRHRASSIQDRRFAAFERTLVIYLINQYDIFHYLIFASPCIIDINNIDNQLDATITAY